MSADAMKFKEWAGSGRGLTAQLRLPNGEIAVPGDIASIAYSVQEVGGGNPTTDALDPDDVITELTAWENDSTGRNFLWQAPGSLWATHSKTYRITITFTPDTDTYPGMPAFKEVWEVYTKNPAAPG
jgi:hypothetical protein